MIFVMITIYIMIMMIFMITFGKILNRDHHYNDDLGCVDDLNDF